jgi:hypothetical protein
VNKSHCCAEIGDFVFDFSCIRGLFVQLQGINGGDVEEDTISSRVMHRASKCFS